jgi:DNA-binding transcriptional MocR family regulator
VGGALDGVERVLGTHLLPGDRVAVEDPCYAGLVDLLAALGLAPEPVLIDEEGPLPAELERAISRQVKAFIITPRSQNPTGAAVSQERAAELRAVLSAHPDLLLIEDDHAAQIAGVPWWSMRPESSKSWAVVRSFAKSLGPDLRVAVLAGDPRTVARIMGRQAAGTGWVPYLMQRLVVSLWTAPGTQEVLKRATAIYAVRRGALTEALASRGIRSFAGTGFNVWVPTAEEQVTVNMLMDAGWGVGAGERYRFTSPPAIRITTATLETSEAELLARNIASCLQPQGVIRLA